MTKQSSIRLLVVGLLLSVAVGAPVASIVANAPHRTASLSTAEVAAPATYEMPEMTVTPAQTLPTITVVGSPARTAPAAKKAEGRAVRCTVRRLDSDYAASVKICEG